MRSRTIRLVAAAAIAGVAVAGLIALTGFGLSLAAWLGIGFAALAAIVELVRGRDRGRGLPR